jgi:hypothetical protein
MLCSQFGVFAHALTGFWPRLESADFQLCQLRTFRKAGQLVTILGLRSRLLRNCASALSGIFRAIKWSHVRRVSIEIRSPDTKFLFVRINPLPQLLARDVSLKPRAALNAHEIGRKPVTVAASPAPAMV